MPQYTVEQGDYLAKIAKDRGFSSWIPIWDDPLNAELRKKRKSPNILYPGDVLYLPEQEPRYETGETERRHRFRLKARGLMLRMVFKDYDDQPVADAECELDLDGAVHSLRTDSAGRIEVLIAAGASQGLLTFSDSDLPFDRVRIRIGHLDPVEEVSGWKARLNNLGYNAGPVDGAESPQLHSAIEEFQCDYFKNVSQVDGQCGPDTQALLEKAHGC